MTATTPGTPSCPRCGTALRRVTEPAGYACPECGGQAAALGQLRRELDAAAVNRLWQAARSAPATGPACPSCTHPTAVVPVFGVELDVCRACQWVWLDAGERDVLPAAPVVAEPAAEELPPEAAAALARLRAAEEERRRRSGTERTSMLFDLLTDAQIWWS